MYLESVAHLKAFLCCRLVTNVCNNFAYYVVEAMEVQRRFDEASSMADVKLQATCFCASAAGAKVTRAMTDQEACCGEV